MPAARRHSTRHPQPNRLRQVFQPRTFKSPPAKPAPPSPPKSTSPCTTTAPNSPTPSKALPSEEDEVFEAARILHGMRHSTPTTAIENVEVEVQGRLRASSGPTHGVKRGRGRSVVSPKETWETLREEQEEDDSEIERDWGAVWATRVKEKGNEKDEQGVRIEDAELLVEVKKSMEARCEGDVERCREIWREWVVRNEVGGDALA